MPSRRGWWFALLVVQIVIALSGFAIGLGVLLVLGVQHGVPAPPRPEPAREPVPVPFDDLDA